MTKTCAFCGKPFIANTKQHMYCSDYCKRRMWEENHKNDRKKRPYVPVDRPDRDPIRKCPKDCKYRGNAGGLISCDYILEKHEPRGCPGGRGCKRYEK